MFHDSFKLADLSDRYVAESVAKYERGFEFDAGFYDLESDRNCDLVGFFQSEKYWKVIQGAVRENFCFDSEIKQKAKKLVPPEVATVSIHVRRGDYVAKSKYHHNISLQWYQQAADRFRDCRPIVFSDDIEWCRFNMSFLQDAIFIDHGVEIEKSPDVKTDELGYIDLCAMSLCNKHIIANSSMSWWSAYLGGGETIAPKQWFGVNGPSDWSDVYPEKESWMIV
ncbi:MAG: alpha-1,2-fucosyltransferase [Pseudomonadota bacterium]